MNVKCEVFVKEALPTTRSLLARRMMNEMGMTQMQVASVLGISQASISQYLSSKRGSSLLKELSSDSQIKSSMDTLLNKLIDRKLSAEQKQNAFCDFCEVATRRLRKGPRRHS